jgi:hypothetical protein
VLLPFDPGEAILNAWSEAYRGAGGTQLRRRAPQAALRAYYRLRPAIPRPAQIALRRLLARAQPRPAFPAWPLETALHDLYAALLRFAAQVAAEPVPWLAPWPAGKRWALVLTHDVETRAGYEHLGLLRDIELEAGYRSSWNFVPRRYAVEDRVVRDLWEAGFEVGVHGLYHDGRDLESRALLERRLPEIRAYAERWRAVGFRSPATHRAWELMPLLRFDYDSSYPHSDPFEPIPGGCLSWLPFQNDGLVELPITLPQDHTLLVILRQPAERVWREQASFLRERGGMALLLTHPDYLLAPEARAMYRRFLEAFASDPQAWRALPREVSAWWRRRAASTIERRDGGWIVVGAAAGEGRICFTEPSGRERWTSS